MPNTILMLLSTPRYHFFIVVVLCTVFHHYNFAFFWLLHFFWNYWDEIKTEYLDYEEYFEDAIDIIGYDTDEVRAVYERYVMIKAYTPSFDLGIDPKDAGRLAKEQGTEDVFKSVNYYSEWDSAELTYLEYIFEWARDEWDYVVDNEPEDQSEGTFDGLNEHYERALETEVLDFSDPLTIDYQPRFDSSLNSTIQNYCSVDQILSLSSKEHFSDQNLIRPYYPYWEENLRQTPKSYRDRFFPDEKVVTRRKKGKTARDRKKGTTVAALPKRRNTKK